MAHDLMQIFNDDHKTHEKVDRLGEDTIVSAYQKRSPASQLEDAEKCS